MDPDPTPDPTPFFSDLKDGKKSFFFICFSYKLTRRHIIFSLKNFACKHYFSPLNNFMRKEKDPDPDPYLLGSY
jgi:hypothetical protein